MAGIVWQAWRGPALRAVRERRGIARWRRGARPPATLAYHIGA
jgi:hypothetical protein